MLHNLTYEHLSTSTSGGCHCRLPQIWEPKLHHFCTTFCSFSKMHHCQSMTYEKNCTMARKSSSTGLQGVPARASRGAWAGFYRFDGERGSRDWPFKSACGALLSHREAHEFAERNSSGQKMLHFWQKIVEGGTDPSSY